ncbi:hypothetical protein CMR26_17085 [Bacillus velezensis]|nr:hypothetical protein CMR26_17085 [Bacillus velezensis]
MHLNLRKAALLAAFLLVFMRGKEAFEKAKRENKQILVIDSMSLSFSNHYIYLLANSLIIKPNS